MTAYVWTGVPAGAAVSVYQRTRDADYPADRPNGPLVASGSADAAGRYTADLPYCEDYRAVWGGFGGVWRAPDPPAPDTSVAALIAAQHLADNASYAPPARPARAA